jgi:hypothetical protein
LASAIPSSPAGAALSTEDAAALVIEQIKNEAAANKK